MPFHTIGRLLGLHQDPFDEPFESEGLSWVGGWWQGNLGGITVVVERLAALPLVRPEAGVRITAGGPIDLPLGPPGSGDRTRHRDFDGAYGLPKSHHGWIGGRARRLLVDLAKEGEVQCVDGDLVFERFGSSRPSRAVMWSRRLARVVTDQRDSHAALDELTALKAEDSEAALRLARRIRGRSNVALNVRVHADALVRRGRKLLRIVEGPDLPSTAREWAAERLAPRYVDDVVDVLLARHRHPGDLKVLARLAQHHEAALLLANHASFWKAELTKAADADRAEALAELVRRLDANEPGPWVDALIPGLVGAAAPLPEVALDVVGRHGSHRALALVGTAMQSRALGVDRHRWRAAHARLRVRFRGQAGAVSLASSGGDLAISDVPPET